MELFIFIVKARLARSHNVWCHGTCIFVYIFVCYFSRQLVLIFRAIHIFSAEGHRLAVGNRKTTHRGGDILCLYNT